MLDAPIESRHPACMGPRVSSLDIDCQNILGLLPCTGTVHTGTVYKRPAWPRECLLCSLIACKEDVCIVQNDTPLGFAAGCKHLSIVRWLLSDDVGADIDAQDSRVICFCQLLIPKHKSQQITYSDKHCMFHTALLKLLCINRLEANAAVEWIIIKLKFNFQQEDLTSIVPFLLHIFMPSMSVLHHPGFLLNLPVPAGEHAPDVCLRGKQYKGGEGAA